MNHRMSIVPSLVATAVLLCAVGAPARADDEVGTDPAGRPALDGMVVEVENWLATPRNLDVDFATVDESGGLSGGGLLQTARFGTASTLRLYAGWRWNGTGAPTIGARFWQVDASADGQTAGSQPQRVGALLASPDFAIGRSLVDTAAATADIRATQVDVLLRWDLAVGPRAWTRLGLGARSFRFEETATITYELDNFGVLREEFVNWHTDTDGLGPVASIEYGYRLASRVAVTGDVGLALPLGETQSRATDAAFADGNLDRATAVEVRGERRATLQLHGRLAIEVKLGRRLRTTLSYAFERWDEARRVQRFIDDVSQNSTVPTTSAAVFEGLAIGLRYGF